jgi:hypothetical protein
LLLRIAQHLATHSVHNPAKSSLLTVWNFCFLQVFITPMPLLRIAHTLGLSLLRNLDEAVSIMRGAMLDVIQVTAGP